MCVGAVTGTERASSVSTVPADTPGAATSALSDQHAFTSAGVECAPPQYTHEMGTSRFYPMGVTTARVGASHRRNPLDTRGRDHGRMLNDEGTSLLIVAADHPSLDGAVARFAGALRAETRYFGPTAAANPKPFPSLVERLSSHHGGFRIAAKLGADVIGMAGVDDHGDVLIAVAESERGRGVGTVLARAVVERARALGFTRLVLRSSRRSRAATALGAAMGFAVVDQGRGRIDLILDLAPVTSTA